MDARALEHTELLAALDVLRKPLYVRDDMPVWAMLMLLHAQNHLISTRTLIKLRPIRG